MTNLFVDMQSPIPAYEFRQVLDAVDASGRQIKMGITTDGEKRPIYPDWITGTLPALHSSWGFDHSQKSYPVRVRTHSGAVFVARLFADDRNNRWYRVEANNQVLWHYEVAGWLPVDAALEDKG